MEHGPRDPVAVRALALSENGCTAVLVSAEILLVPGVLHAAIERRVRDLKLDGLIVAATHTHAGPGGYWKHPVGERIATGPFDRSTFDHLVERTERAIRMAVAALEPAYFSMARGEAKHLVRNRAGALLDGRLLAIRFVARAGHTIAEVLSFPAHATLLGLENRTISGDWPGALIRGQETPLLFFQGSLGDQSASIPPRTSSTPDAYARLVRARVAELHYSTPDPWPELAVAVSTALLPAPETPLPPRALRQIARNVLYRVMPDRAQISALRIGPVTLIAIPGEPVAEVGRRWRAAAGEGAEILALANDWVGYVETSEQTARAAGETARTVYGPELAERLAGAVSLAAQATRFPGEEAGPARR